MEINGIFEVLESQDEWKVVFKKTAGKTPFWGDEVVHKSIIVADKLKQDEAKELCQKLEDVLYPH